MYDWEHLPPLPAQPKVTPTWATSSRNSLSRRCFCNSGSFSYWGLNFSSSLTYSNSLADNSPPRLMILSASMSQFPGQINNGYNRAISIYCSIRHRPPDLAQHSTNSFSRCQIELLRSLFTNSRKNRPNCTEKLHWATVVPGESWSRQTRSGPRTYFLNGTTSFRTTGSVRQKTTPVRSYCKQEHWFIASTKHIRRWISATEIKHKWSTHYFKRANSLPHLSIVNRILRWPVLAQNQHLISTTFSAILTQPPSNTVHVTK